MAALDEFPTPTATALVSSRHRVDDDGEAQELYHARGWTDGLPVVAPTAERVAACLDWAAMPPHQVIGVEPVRARPLTAEKVAVNAVLAGCLPPHFPVVAAAVEAMCKPEFLLHGATSSTGGCAVMVIVNGPVRRQLGMSGTFNALAGTDRASMVIGRSVRLVLQNLLDVRPGELDRSTLGHPGKISFCVAEDEEGSPWVPLAQERGIPADTSAVTVFAASGPRQIMNEWTTDPTEILTTFAAEIRAHMLDYSIWGGNYVIVVPKQLRDRLHEAGLTKADVRAFLHEHAVVRRGEWAGVGKGAVVGHDRADKVYPAFTKPEHVLVGAAGGPAGGFGAVIPPWLGHRSHAATAAVGACVDC
jgi:hypothetical protein